MKHMCFIKEKLTIIKLHIMRVGPLHAKKAKSVNENRRLPSENTDYFYSASSNNIWVV